jgi:hypothetical protein
MESLPRLCCDLAIFRLACPTLPHLKIIFPQASLFSSIIFGVTGALKAGDTPLQETPYIEVFGEGSWRGTSFKKVLLRLLL